MNTLVLGHGRKHRALPDIDYTNSTFVDRDIKCNPDIVIDLKTELLPNNMHNKYSEAVMVNCSRQILQDRDYLCSFSISNIISCIKPGGLLYISNIYYLYPHQNRDEERNRLVHDIESLCPVKFVKEQERLGIQRGKMLVFTKQ
jgi:hypothetical protein